MDKVGKGKLAVFFIILILLIALLVYVNLTRPAMDKAKQLADQLSAKQERLQALTDAIHSGDESVHRLLFLNHAIRNQVPERPYEDLILRDLRLFEVTSGMQMDFYQIESSEERLAVANGVVELSETGLFGAINVSTSLEGTYDQMARMLEEIETMNRLYHVEQITMEADKEERIGIVTLNNQDIPIKTNLMMRTYYLPTLQSEFAEPLERDYAPPGGREHLLE